MENSREQLFKAVIHLDGHKTGSLAFSVRAPIDLVVSGDILVSFKEHDIRFVYDKNWPKLQIDSLSDIDFYSEFSPTFQRFKFIKKNETLGVSGTRHDSSDSYVRFFSQLVGERLVDFQCKIAYIMKSIGFALNDFNFVVYSFQLTGVDGVITVVDDPVTVPL